MLLSTRMCGMRLRIYTDTSVLGGAEDDEFREASLSLISSFQRGETTLVLSELTVRELAAAPKEVRKVLDRIPSVHIESLALSEEAESWPPHMLQMEPSAPECGWTHCTSPLPPWLESMSL